MTNKPKRHRRTKAEMLAAMLAARMASGATESKPAASDVTLGEFAGPDPQLVAEHQAKVAAAPPAPGPRSFVVQLPDRYAAYLLDYAARQSIRRGGIKITPERALEIMVRETWRLDQDRMLETAGATIPASAFNPKAGMRS